MSSFSAELLVAGAAFPLTNCTFGVQQATHERGRVSAKVRYEPVHLALDVPTGEELFGWANTPTKRLRVAILFRNMAGGRTLETLSMAAAYCVSYQETFAAGDVRGGAYQAFLTLTDPDGWTLTAGGPASAYVAPAARDHGLPTAALAAVQAASAAAPFVLDALGVPRLPLITGKPPFTVKGPSKGKPGLDRAEFARQLLGQQNGLNQLTVAAFIANRDHYNALRQLKGDGRDPKGDAAQKVAREEALSDKTLELRRQDPSLTRKQAQEQAEKWLETQTALHNPDQVAGGHAAIISGMGDARVNSSIGAQWPKRIKAIDQQVRTYASQLTPAEQAATYLDINLPLT